jgi:hypothetical protein
MTRVRDITTHTLKLYLDDGDTYRHCDGHSQCDADEHAEAYADGAAAAYAAAASRELLL